MYVLVMTSVVDAAKLQYVLYMKKKSSTLKKIFKFILIFFFPKNSVKHLPFH